jgi:hypothetical protein
MSVVLNESLISAVGYLISAALISAFTFIALIFYFSFFTSSTKEEGLLDYDMMQSSVTVEAEEEISSLDDVLLTFIIIIVVFG